MSFEEQVESLKAKHHALELEINSENRRPYPDDIAIAELKKKKLRLKDQIEDVHH